MIKIASGGGENSLVSAAAIKYLQLLLADRTSLRGHPAIVYLNQYGAGRVGSNSSTSQFTVWGLDGYDAMATVAEGVAMTETALTNALKTATWARKGLRRDLSDDVRSLDGTGQLNPMRLAMDGFGSAMVTLTNLIAALMSGFSVQKGTTGVAFSHDLWLLGKGALIEAGVPGPYLSMLHLNHFADWINDLESRGGLTQWRPASADMQILRGPGFQGTYDGVDVFSTNRVPTSGSDYVSGMFGRGAVGYVEQEVVYGPEAIILLENGPIAVEIQRTTGGAGASQILTHYRVGAAEIEDGRGVGLLASA